MKLLRNRFTVAGCFICACTVLVDAQPPKKKALTPAEESPADLSEDEAREQAVASRFRAVLEANPRRGTALDRLYGYHVERGTLEKLIGEFTQRTRKNERDGKAWMVVGLLEAQRGKDAAAVAAFTKAEEFLPDNAIPAYYLGQSLVLIGQPEKAAEAFERALQRKPNRNDLLDIFQALGRVYQRSQRAEKALGVWNRLEKRYPDDARVQEQIASTLVDEGEFAQALPRLEKLARSTEDNYRQATLKMEIAELKVKLKRTPEALADFEKLTADLQPNSWLYREVRRHVEEVFLKNDDLAGLVKYYERWLAANPTDIDAIARIAKNLSAQGRADDARSWLEKGIAVAPSNRAVRQALIDHYAFEKNYTAAAAQYELMDKYEPGNPDILRDWGRLLMRDSSRPEAERKAAASAIWKRILDKKPKDAVTASQVADLMRGAGIVDDAIALYQKAITLAPDAAQYREYLGEFFHSLKRTDEALAAWRPIAEGVNRTAGNLNRLAEVFAGFGYRKEAVAAMAEAIKLENNDFTMRMRFAELLHADGRHDDALGEITAAAKLVSNPEESEQILAARIKIFQTTDKLGDEIERLEKQLGDHPQSGLAEKFLTLARYQEANRQIEKATAAIARAAEIDSKSIAVLIAAARIHEAGGNMLAASDANRRLAALDRRFRTDYLQSVARLEQRLGRGEQALQAGRDLLAASPGNPDVYKFYAELCFQLGDPEEGLDALRRSVRANPAEPSGLITLASALSERMRQGEAIELLWRAFEKTNDLEGRLGLVDRLAQVYLDNNHFDKLIERLERERREAEKSREFTMCIAQAFQAAGDLGTARTQLERLFTDNTRDAALLGQLVQLCERENDVSSALKYQRLLVAAAPNNTDHQLKLAQLLIRSGEGEEAADIWVKLVADGAEPHRNLAAIDQLLSAQKYDPALAILSRMLVRQPGNWELLYREGAALVAMGKKADASKRFRAILAMRQADDELGEQAKNMAAQQKKKQRLTPNAPISFVATASQFDDTLVAPISRRLARRYDVSVAVGLTPDQRYYGPGNQPMFYAPNDFGEARAACQGWLYALARDDDKQEEYLGQLRAACSKPNPELREMWDYYYLQTLRNERKEASRIALELSRTEEPAGYLVFLNSLLNRSENEILMRRSSAVPNDKTPPLPADQLEHAIVCYRKLRQFKPEWVERQVTSMMLLELKRSKNDAELNQIYQNVLKDANTDTQMIAAMEIAAERGDAPALMTLFHNLQKWRPSTQASTKLDQLPTRRPGVYRSFVTAMGKQMDAKHFVEARGLLDKYLAAMRQENSMAPTVARSARRNRAAYGNVLYTRRPGGASKVLSYPPPNNYFSTPAIEMLYNAVELHNKADLASDLRSHFRKQVESLPGPEKVYAHLALGYLLWWAEERDQAIEEMTRAVQAAPNDHMLLLDVAWLREQNNEFAAALEMLDSIMPLDHQMMQQREEAALRVAERLGDVPRARQAADRLFGMRLDTEKQLELAGQMHRLGMHSMAETVLGRSQRQAGNNSSTLLRLMNQYQSQNQSDLAVQIARQILRKSPQVTPNSYNQNDEVRTQAISVLARSGLLTELIERTQAQLRTSPTSLSLHQALMDCYRAAGDKEKQKAVALKMVELKPDDGKMRYAVAQRLTQLGDTANALIQYREAIRRDPSGLQDCYWEVETLFSQAGKFEELSQLMDEIDMRKMGQSFIVYNIIESLFQNESTQQLGMKLLRKAWAALPAERLLISRVFHHEQMHPSADIYGYLREALIPRTGSDHVNWSAAANVTSWGVKGTVNTPLTQLLAMARKQGRLGELRQEIAGAIAANPEWAVGKVMHAIVEIQDGDKEQGLKDLRQCLTNNPNMPGIARAIVAQEMEYYAGTEPLALEILEAGVEEFCDWLPNFEMNPVRRLVWRYEQLERHEDAKKLLVRFLNTEKIDPGYGNNGYWQYVQINTKLGIAGSLTHIGYPVEAIRILSDLSAHPEDIRVANSAVGNPDALEVMIEKNFHLAIKALNPETISREMNSLLTPRAEKGEAALDLIVVLEAADISAHRVVSIFQTALRMAGKNPQTERALLERLAALRAEYPNDLSVAIASSLRAFEDDKPDVLAERLQALMKLVDATELEPLPPGEKANARQRQEARQQLALWIVARECLQKGREKQAAVGRRLAERAVAAAQRQAETALAQGILREWGELELAGGNKAEAEARWSEWLDMLLPKPSARKTSGPARSVKGPETRAAPGGTPSKPAAGASTPTTAPMLTSQQFRQIFTYAQAAADGKMAELSLKAMKEALKGGPPSPSPNQGGGGYQSRFIKGTHYYYREGDPHRISVDSALSVMVAKWRGLNLPARSVYGVLADIAFPPGRPAEVFLNFAETGADNKYYTLSNGRLQPLGFDPEHANAPPNFSRLLVKFAVDAQQTDDLRQRCHSRSGQPLGELPAEVLLLALAAETQDDTAAREHLRKISGRIQKDSLQTSLALATTAAAAALSRPALETDAEAFLVTLVDRSAKLTRPDATARTLLFEYRLRKNDRADAKKVLDAARTANKAAGDSEDFAELYLRAGYIEEALDEIGQRLDAATAAKSDDPKLASDQPEPNCTALAALWRSLLDLEPSRRYEILKKWTFPTSGRKSLRYHVGVLPSEPPPAAFVQLPPLPVEPMVSTMILLVDSAQKLGKTDEILASADQLVKEKVENAELFRVLAYLACGRGQAIETDAKKLADAVYERLTAKPEPHLHSRFSAPTAAGGAFRFSDCLLAWYCLAEPALATHAEKLSDVLLRKSQMSGLSEVRVARELHDRVIVQRHAAPTACESTLPPRWHNGLWRSTWLSQDGLVMGNLRDQVSHLFPEIPLTGSYEFSVEMMGQGAVSAAGLWFKPNLHEIGEIIGNYDLRISRWSPANRSAFNKLTVRVTPQKISCLVNDKLWFEDTPIASTFPWLTITSMEDRPVYRRFVLSGNPEIPTEVRLQAGDSLAGWISPFIGQIRLPSRLVERERNRFPNRYQNRDRSGEERRSLEANRYDWEPQEGALRGRLEDPNSPVDLPNHLAYVRPLRPGDAVTYEFFHKENEFHVDPCLGRLAFMLDGDGVKWHWLADSSIGAAQGGDWLTLKADHAVRPPANYKCESVQAHLKNNSWNTVKVSIIGDEFCLELNGAVIHGGPIPERIDTRFGLFHFRNRTEARVRNAVLTGAWPKQLKEGLAFGAEPVPPALAKARRELIGERHYALEAGEFLKETRALSAAEQYRLLAAWVLPRPERPVYQFGGSWKNEDILGVVDAKEQPPGQRVMRGGRLESPVLELVNAAKKQQKLEELAARVNDWGGKDDHRMQQCQKALQFLILAAQNRPSEARAKLNELTRDAEALPVGFQQPWPYLLAAAGSLEQPELLSAAAPLAQALNENIRKSIDANQPVEDLLWWSPVVRLIQAEILWRIEVQRARTTTAAIDPFQYWTVAHGVTQNSRNDAAHFARWLYADNKLVHYPGHSADFLILKTPLRGDFELRCTLLLGNQREAYIGYGGCQFRLDKDRKNFRLQTGLSQASPKLNISPPLKDQKSSVYAFRMSVRGGTVSFFVDDQLIETRYVGPSPEPWLMIQCDLAEMGEVRDLTITGSPHVPERINLASSEGCPLWRPYADGARLAKRGEEIFRNGGEHPQQDLDDDADDAARDPLTRLTESAFYYQRPIAEDGTIDYEFFYNPDKTLAHPMLDRLVFLLEPGGVKLHWLTDGPREQSQCPPSNSRDEPACRRGPAQIPLVPKSWNKMRLQVQGNMVQLTLNGVLIYERPLESTNQRVFGLFHYAYQTELRVRDIIYAGNWEKRLPEPDQLFAPSTGPASGRR